MLRLLTISVLVGLLALGCGKKKELAPETGGGLNADFAPPLTETYDNALQRLHMAREDDRMIVSEASLKIEAEDPEQIHLAVIDAAARYSGYVVNSSEIVTTIRIPSVSFDQAMTEIALLGEVLDRRITGRDVTESYKDLRTRLDNAEKTRQRYLALLDRANSIQEVLRVERELERINSEIEMLKGKIEQLSHLTTYATINVYPVVPKTDGRLGPISFVARSLFNGIKWLF